MYHVAQVCPNGHVVTTSADKMPQFQEAFCSECGEATLMHCSGCDAPIRGYYHVEGVLRIGDDYHPPAFCHNCGSAFPWTERKIAGAVELVQVDGKLSDEELLQFKSDLTELTKDSPKTAVASLRFKQVMTTVGTSIASGVRSIVVDVLSEPAKKAIWGK